MLSILIIDDTQKKVDTLRNFICRKFDSIRESDIEHRRNTSDAFKLMRTRYFDLVMLDLNIPKKDKGKVSPKNAVDFLEQINEFGELIKQPAHILGITQMQGVPAEFRESFENSLWSLFCYGPEYNEWEDKLERKIQYLQDSKQRLRQNPDYDYDVAIINALSEPEHTVMMDVFGGDWVAEEFDGDKCETYYTKTLEKDNGERIRIVSVAQPQMASTASSALTAKMLYHYRPRYLFMTGIAAAVDPKECSLGDIMVAAECWDGASGKYKDGKFHPDPRHLNVDPVMINILTKAKKNKKLLHEITLASEFAMKKKLKDVRVHIGQMASVPAVIAMEKKIKEISEHARKLMGIEMETYGVYYAAAHSVEPRPKFFASIKSVSDYATVKKKDNFQDYASYTSAAFLKYVIMNGLDYT